MTKPRSVQRGKARVIAGADGGPIEVRLYGCMVSRAPHEVNGKTYVTFDISAAGGDLEALRRVDAFVASVARPAFSPLTVSGEEPVSVIAKLPAGTKYENEAGDPALPWELLTNALVDVVLRSGAYGSWGYCWLVHRVKPHATRT